MSILRIRRLVLSIFILFCVVILGFVFYQHTNPLGRERVYDYTLSRKINPFIFPLAPKERLSRHYQDQSGDWMKDLKGPLVYFDCGPVSEDRRLKLTITYRAEVPEIRFGEVTSEGDELTYNVHPFYNAFLQSLDWEAIQDPVRGLTLYQKEKRFASIDAYLNHVPLDKVNAVYFFQDSRITNAQTLTRFVDPSQEVDFIITQYQKAQVRKDGWLESSFEFDLKNSVLRQDVVTYLFSIPAFEKAIVGPDTILPKVTITNIRATIYEQPSKYWVRLRKMLLEN